MKSKGAWTYPTAFSSWGDEERQAIEGVVRSGQYTMGEQVAAFEQEFAEWHGLRYGVMCNSGSSANLLMVSALIHSGRVGRGRIALVPAIAWSTTYAPLVQHDMQLRLVDCDSTWNARSGNIEDFKNIELVVGCPILGNPLSPDWALAAQGANIPYIEDNCESLGARDRHGRPAGTRGIMNSFSFFYSHQISAIEGGMVLTDDLELASLCKMLRAHGWSRDIVQTREFDREYDFRVFGYNLRPLEVHAAVAREQLKKLPGFREARASNSEYFWSRVGASAIGRPHTSGVQSPFGIQFTVPPGTRARIAETLRAAGIDCRLPTGGSFRRHAYGKHWENQATPRADYIHDNGMFIGNPPWPAPELVDRAAAVIRAIVL